VTGLVQQHDVLTVGNPSLTELDSHPPAQRLGIQQSFGQRIGDQESANRSWGERPLLPGQTHCHLPS
jgi:hypothetical protein